VLDQDFVKHQASTIIPFFSIGNLSLLYSTCASAVTS
jgi:hypothetical protein